PGGGGPATRQGAARDGPGRADRPDRLGRKSSRRADTHPRRGQAELRRGVRLPAPEPDVALVRAVGPIVGQLPDETAPPPGGPRAPHTRAAGDTRGSIA